MHANMQIAIIYNYFNYSIKIQVMIYSLKDMCMRTNYISKLRQNPFPSSIQLCVLWQTNLPESSICSPL